MALTYGDYLEFQESVTAQSKGNRVMEPKDTGSYLAGYLSPFQLCKPGATYLLDHGVGAWNLPFLEPWWSRPGRPCVPQGELARFEMGRVNFILRDVFENAVKQNEFDFVTKKRGRDQVELLRRCGLGYLV